MSNTNIISITELMEKTEQWLLSQGYKKSTLGVYKATWNRLRAFSESPLYNRETAEEFLLKSFGIQMELIGQNLDTRMRHARRHINALDEFLREGKVSRRKVLGLSVITDDRFYQFFSEYLDYCRIQNYSKSWLDNTIAGLKIFLLAVHQTNTVDPQSIDTETVNCFADAMRNANEICMNVRQTRCRQVGSYLHWLYACRVLEKDFSLQLPNFKRTPQKLPQIWTPEEIDRVISAIDAENPVGKRNRAIFLLIARTGLRISDVIGLKFSNIDWKNNCITISQQKTGNVLGLPISEEIGMAIISYLQNGRPKSSSDYVFLGHNAPFEPLNNHNNFNTELRKYMRRAGITFSAEKHTGVHTFRHSFATNMLKSGTSVQDISQILGHGNISVTETYLRVDIEQMRMCSISLEVLS
ncbi:MAG: tyrosine-type recombinase/integrase [Clostridia bacterium]|nr:tyrosine-type recombinase/integrase [Clostridia bacterium]